MNSLVDATSSGGSGFDSGDCSTLILGGFVVRISFHVLNIPYFISVLVVAKAADVGLGVEQLAKCANSSAAHTMASATASSHRRRTSHSPWLNCGTTMSLVCSQQPARVSRMRMSLTLGMRKFSIV